MKQIAALMSLAAMVALTQPAPAAAHRQKHAVETFFMSGIAAFNAHDLDTFMKQFAEDVEMYTPTGWLRGRAAVRERFAETFQKFPSVRMK